jgi:hypothetical protein
MSRVRMCVLAGMVSLGMGGARVRAKHLLVLGPLCRFKLVPELCKLVGIVVGHRLFVVDDRSESKVVHCLGRSLESTLTLKRSIIIIIIELDLPITFFLFFILQLRHAGDGFMGLGDTGDFNFLSSLYWCFSAKYGCDSWCRGFRMYSRLLEQCRNGRVG